MTKTQAIAIYLPQFHSIPENDEWWGKGFTEWRTVKAAKPFFPSHYQPHVPHKSVGYYDLSDLDTIERQHALAYRYGVSSFCYYYYNFSGVKPLEKPLLLINDSKKIKNSFCLCWANEPWTRVWYGQNKEILIDQEYSPENAVSMFDDLLKYFQNDRYIKVDNKPMLLVYRATKNPFVIEYSTIWNQMAKTYGFDGIFLVSVEAGDTGIAPELFGFDATVEFAPDWFNCVLAGHDHDARPRRFDYQETIKRMMLKPIPPYLRMKCAFPGWDNTARYKNNSTVFVNNTPGSFKFALEHAKEYTQKNLPENLQYVFVNAWNEWSEGCHLEPDEKYGYTYLKIMAEIFGKEK